MAVKTRIHDAFARRHIAALAMAALVVALSTGCSGGGGGGGTRGGGQSAQSAGDFIRQVTAVRTPWAYLRLLPQTVWTLIPAIGILAARRPEGRTRCGACTGCATGS